MIQVIEIGNELFSNSLMIFLLAWVVARAVEVWLKVIERIEKRLREHKEREQ